MLFRNTDLGFWMRSESLHPQQLECYCVSDWLNCLAAKSNSQRGGFISIFVTLNKLPFGLKKISQWWKLASDADGLRNNLLATGNSEGVAT